MIKVRALGPLKALLGRGELELGLDEVEIEGLIEEVGRSVKDARRAEITPSSLLIAVNGVEISALKGVKTIVGKGDEVVLIPVVHGG